MAGKSTFLRTMGVNLVLAQSGAPVCASSIEFSPCDVFSITACPNSSISKILFSNLGGYLGNNPKMLFQNVVRALLRADLQQNALLHLHVATVSSGTLVNVQ